MKMKRQMVKWGGPIWLFAVVAFWLPAGVFAQSGEQVFRLDEHLNRVWRDQMVRYSFEADHGRCDPVSVTLEGPAGPMPVQLSEVELWEGTPHVRRAVVSFYVDELQPLATHDYVLRYRADGAAAAIPSGLSISENGDVVEIANARFGVRLLAGSREFDTPVPFDDVPPPMRAIRMANGEWTGSGRMFGDIRIRSYAAELAARGPVYAEVRTTYRFEDGGTAVYEFRVPAGDRAVMIEAASDGNHPESGWDLTLGGDSVRFGEAVQVAHRSYRAGENRVSLSASDDPFAELAPWAGWWWWGFPTLLRLKADDAAAGQVHVTSRDTGTWVEPQPLAQSADFRHWAPGSMGWVWGRMHRSRMPFFARENGGVTIRCNHRRGVRRWTLSLDDDGAGQFATFTGGNQTAHTPNPRLDEVKDMVLAWPDGEPRNPHLFLNAEDLAAAAESSPALWEGLHNVAALVQTLDALGRIDLMRNPMAAIGRYDALVNSDRITVEQRKLIRAQAAYLAYRLASPLTWSVERGYTSGNPNMSVSFAANLGLFALALRDHPMSDAWLADVVEKMDFWLETVVDEHGYWPESSHYARVSWANMVLFGIAATRAGVRDYVGDPKFRMMAEFYERTLTPGDPTRPTEVRPDPESPAAAPRTNPPYGRGVRFDVWGFGGPLARAAAERYPEFSRIMQWSWERSAYSAFLSHEPAGLTQLYADRNLPSAVPDWSSEFFTHLGFLFRRHLGTPAETYLLLSSRMARNADGEIWPADVGGILKWFAHGRPVATAFPRGPASHVALVNRVALAGNWDPAAGDGPDNRYHTETQAEDFAPMPHIDYARVAMTITDTLAYGHDIRMPGDVPALPVRDRTGEAPLGWHRQVMMVDDETPGGVQYLIVRDTVESPQPTQWHFWTLSEKLGTPDEVADRDAFLDDRPGGQSVPLRELRGDRFTAIGQFGIDVEYFIAAPSGTPRHTMRYGLGGGAYGALGQNTYQDLLHLQMPGEGAYFVAMFPRPAEAEVPEFSTEGDGRVIRVRGEFGEDLAFLGRSSAKATAGAAVFEGTAAHVKDREKSLTLSLLADGQLGYGDWRITAGQPVRLLVRDADVTVTVASNFPGGEIRFRSPEALSPVDAAAPAAWVADANEWVLTLPAGARQVDFTVN